MNPTEWHRGWMLCGIPRAEAAMLLTADEMEAWTGLAYEMSVLEIENPPADDPGRLFIMERVRGLYVKMRHRT